MYVVSIAFLQSMSNMAGTPDLKSLISYHVVVSKCASFLLFAEHFMREFVFRNTSRPRCSLLPHLPS